MTTENHILWDGTFLYSLYEGAPPVFPTPYPLPLPPPPPPSLINCAFKQIQRQNTISMNSCIQYQTKNRKEKRQMSKYAIKKIENEVRIGR